MTASDQNTAGLERLTTSEVCQRLRISRSTLWRRVSSGTLPVPVDRGRQALFAASEIDAVMRGAALTAPSGDTIDVAIERRLVALAQRRRRRPLKA